MRRERKLIQIIWDAGVFNDDHVSDTNFGERLGSCSFADFLSDGERSGLTYVEDWF
jgi:hypothetical protein